jgi:thiamine-monophosphate kinase
MMGFEALQAEQGDSSAYRRPVARLKEGQDLTPHVTAMMDISDGLLLDACRMARASGVSIAIDSADVPIATPEDRRGDALRWGDDYQLLFTIKDKAAVPVTASRIGTVLSGSSSPLFLDGDALDESDDLGYRH